MECSERLRLEDELVEATTELLSLKEQLDLAQEEQLNLAQQRYEAARKAYSEHVRDHGCKPAPLNRYQRIRRH